MVQSVQTLGIAAAGEHTALAHVVGRPWLDIRCPPKPLHHSAPQLDRGEKI